MDYKDLNVWKESLELVEIIYNFTKHFPKEEIYGLSFQMKRAAISIPSNIAEGANRNTKKEFVQFLYIALGSASELETHIYIAKKLGFLKDIENILLKLTKIRKMINALINSMKNNENSK